MTTAITERKELVFEPENISKETVKKYICASATDQEILFFLQVAKTFNLNPLKREIYLVKYGEEKAQILTGYEVYLKRAQRSGQYGGMKSWTEGEGKELKAIVEVYRKDWTKPLIHEAYYSEYVQTKKDGTPNRFWATKPRTMIKKVAISQAFRLAFPDEFDGMPYTSDEVVDQEKVIDIADVVKVDEEEDKNVLAMRQSFENIKVAIGEDKYKEVLNWHEIKDVSTFSDLVKGKEVYADLKKHLGKDGK